MPIKSGEIGKALDVGTFFDVSSGTGVKTITVTNPSTGVKTTFLDARITTPATASPDGYAANTYMRLITQVGDFPDDGVWPLCCRFIDTSASPDPIDYFGDDNTITIGEGCEE